MGFGKLEDTMFEDYSVTTIEKDQHEDDLFWGLHSDFKGDWDSGLNDYEDAVVPQVMLPKETAEETERIDALTQVEESFSPASYNEQAFFEGEQAAPLPNLQLGKSQTQAAPVAVDSASKVTEAAVVTPKQELTRVGSTSVLTVPDMNAASWTRNEALERYRRKKANRCFKKKIRYQCRKRIASDRPRVGGRFARIDKVGSCVSLDGLANSS